MPPWATVLLRISAVCLFLGQAWIHFFWETHYEVVLDGAFSPTIAARGIGLILLFCGLVVIVWKPKWICALVLFFSIVPLAVHAIASGIAAETERDRVAVMAASATLVFTPLILMIGGRLDIRAGGVFLSRLSLSLTFATFALLAFGQTAQVELPKIGALIIGLPRPELWETAATTMIPTLAAAEFEMVWRALAAVAFLSCIALWFRPITVAPAILLSLLGITGLTSIIWTNIVGADDILGQIHRWGPEAVMRLPLAILPIALWQMIRMRRRKLKRVDPGAPGVPLPTVEDETPEDFTIEPRKEDAPDPVPDPNIPKKRKKNRQKLKRIDDPKKLDAKPDIDGS